MDGVTILQTIEVAQYGWGWNWWAIIPIIAAIALLIVSFITFDDGGGFLGFFVGLLVVIAVDFCMDAKELPPTYQYQVLIEDNVNMNDFLDKYTIVEQQGITYIIEIKEED